MKAYYEPIEVEPASGSPSLIRWRQQTYRVRHVLDYWILQNRWWEREEKRLYLLLETEPATTMEIYRVGKDWKLARIVD